MIRVIKTDDIEAIMGEYARAGCKLVDFVEIEQQPKHPVTQAMRARSQPSMHDRADI
jgi:hypothetical protein